MDGSYEVWKTVKSVISIAGLLFGLSACGGSKHDDLKTFVNSLEKNDAKVVAELQPLKSYPPAIYQAESDGLRDPFSPPVRRSFSSKAADCKQVDHPKETLEEYALDALRMVGTMHKEGKLWGIVKDPNGAVHNVTVGNFLGRNNGQIKDISEGQIILVEMVEDGMGECGWIEREASLALND